MGGRSVLTVLAMIVAFAGACGSEGEGSSAPITEASPELLLVSSGAQWVAGDGPLTEFDVTSQKTDEDVFGVEVEWVFETTEEGPRISPNVEISVRIDGQATPNAVIPIRLGGTDSGLLAPDVNPVYLVENEAGFTIHFVLGPVLGASDLRSEQQIREGLEENFGDLTDVDDVELDPMQDEGDDGVLSYRVSLRGSIEVDGEPVEVESTVEFATIESEPGIEAMMVGPRARDAVATERRRAHEAEASG